MPAQDKMTATEKTPRFGEALAEGQANLARPRKEGTEGHQTCS